jgi:hypothetical protein
MAKCARRVWLLYLAVLFNAAVYLDYIEATVLTFVWRRTDEVGDFIRFIGWEPAFDAVDLLVVAWLLGATTCLFVRRASPHRFAVMTNLFLVPCAIIPLARHCQYYRHHLEAYPPSLARLAELFHFAAMRGTLLLLGALLLLAPSVRSFFETQSSTTNRSILTAAVAAPCFLFCAAVIYVRAPW